jgi:hypothetical protein
LGLEEWKKENFFDIWLVVIGYFITYISLLIYSILRMKFTEKELDGYKMPDSIIGKNFSFLLLVVGFICIICFLLPWGYLPFNLQQLFLLLSRLFQPKPADYGSPHFSSIFWQFKLLFLKPKIAVPPSNNHLNIPSNVFVWILTALGILGVFFGIRERFFVKVFNILKEGFVKLIYSFLELGKEIGKGLVGIRPSFRSLPKMNLGERPKSIIGWILYYYKISLRLMAKKGMGKEIWETPYEYAKRISNLNPDISPFQREITEIFISTRYKNTNPRREWIESIKEKIKQMRKRL